MSVKPADHTSQSNGGALDDASLLDREVRDDAAELRDDELSLIDRVRDRLEIGAELSDITIAASLAAIAANSDNRGRWLAAFGSPLGRWLASRGSDLNTSLNTLLAMTPRPH